MRLRLANKLCHMHKWQLPGLGEILVGESGRRYVICSDPVPLGNLVRAKDADNEHTLFAISQPRSSTELKRRERYLRQFEDGMRMSKIFRSTKHIWKRVDMIKSTSDHEPPRVVSEHMGESLSEVRLRRLFTRKEVKTIMKSTLLALQEIESKGFFYPGLSSEDVLVYESAHTSEPTNYFTKLWAPAGEVFSPWKVHHTDGSFRDAYCAPEVIFEKPGSFPAHIWSWGVILTHLLESRASWIHNKHEALHIGVMFERWNLGYHYGSDSWTAIRELVGEFGIYESDYYVDCEIPDHRELRWKVHIGIWKQHLLDKGLREDDVCFLDWVLDLNPETRPTSEQIMESGFLDWNEEDSIAV